MLVSTVLLDADVVFNDNDPSIQAKFHLFPPHRMCLAPHCTQTKKGVALYHAHQQEVVVFTLKDGPCEAKAVHFYCEGQSVHALFAAHID